MSVHWEEAGAPASSSKRTLVTKAEHRLQRCGVPQLTFAPWRDRMLVMHEQPRFQITPVRTAEDLAAIVMLFRVYATSLDIDLSYQNFELEIASMPGEYAPPAGELLLARNAQGKPIGCVGLRPIETEGCCELKRLYVSPEVRGIGLGKDLVDALVNVAERIGYVEMKLDTLPSMARAQAMYRKLGFEVIEPYYDTPVIGTLFMRRILCAQSPHKS